MKKKLNQFQNISEINKHKICFCYIDKESIARTHDLFISYLLIV